MVVEGIQKRSMKGNVNSRIRVLGSHIWGWGKLYAFVCVLGDFLGAFGILGGGGVIPRRLLELTLVDRLYSARGD